VDVEQALFDHFFLTMFGHYLFVQGFLLRVFDDVLHPHESLSKIASVLDVASHQRLDDELGGLVAIVLQQVVDDQFVDVEQVSVLVWVYYSLSMSELSMRSTSSHLSCMMLLMNLLVLTVFRVIFD
jgi:hypothetical protein